MKLWTMLLFLGTLASVSANAEFFGDLNHKVIKNGFAQRGKVVISTTELPESDDRFEVEISYDLDIRVFFFDKNVKGSEAIIMPNTYQSEQGFLDLQRERVYRDRRVTLTHRGRTDWNEFYDCHKVLMDPALHDRWEGEFIYCPGAPKSGIVELKLLVKSIPLLGQGTVLSQWK